MALTLPDIKTHLRLETDADPVVDAELNRMHEAALEHASAFIGKPIPWTDVDPDTLLLTEVYPKSVEQAVLVLIGELYMNRESSVIGTIVADLPTVRMLLHPHRVGLGV